MKSKYFPQGLGVLTPGAGWINSDGSSVNASGNPDLYLMSNDINTSKMANRVTAYGDWSVDSVLSDDTTDKLKLTFVKGSPYVFAQFANPAAVELYSPVISGFFDDSTTPLLTTDGASVTADHIGVRIANVDGSPSATAQTRYYGLFAPPGTVFCRVGAKIKIQLGSSQNYLSVGALTAASDLNYVYQHAYAFVTGTQVSYAFDEPSAQVTTHFNVTTTLKRTGFSNQTLQALLPHQWKSSTSSLTALVPDARARDVDHAHVRGCLLAGQAVAPTGHGRPRRGQGGGHELPRPVPLAHQDHAHQLVHLYGG